MTPLGNNSEGNTAGVNIRNSASNNTIGGVDPGEGNVIAYNDPAGVRFFSGTGNSVRGNLIYNNGVSEFDFGTAVLTPNDAGDPDAGPNNLQNYPVLRTATLAGGLSALNVSFEIDSVAPNSVYPIDVDFYGLKAGQPPVFLGSARAFTPISNQTANLGDVSGFGLTAGDSVTAIATDANGNSSQFAPAKTIDDRQAGATLNVNTTSDGSDGFCSALHCTLREAVDQANTLGATLINVPAGTYVLNDDAGGLTVSTGLTIQGAGSANTFIDGSGIGNRIFTLCAIRLEDA